MYREFLKKFDWTLFLSVAILTVLSLTTIYGITLSQEQLDFSVFERQFVFVGIGVALMLGLAILGYTIYRASAPSFYIFGLIALIAVLFLGKTVRGTSGWFALGIFNFQPVEFAKLALIIALARFFSKNLNKKRSEWLMLKSGLIALAPVMLVILQPDFGSAMLLFGVWAGLLLILGVKKRHIIIAIVLLAVIGILSWQYLIADYQKDRVLTFLDPARDPWGSGYNIRQATIAIGSGQIFGRGLGFGAQTQLKFLPEAQTDFIFAVIAEELGFVAVLFIIICYGVILYRGIKIGGQSRDNFAYILSIGIVFLIFLETVINISMNLGVFPVAGLTLPFLSYGGSSLLMHFAMIGILQGIAVRR